MNPARVDHVGSLLRPEGLKQVFLRHAQGQADASELRAAQDAAIRVVVAGQEQHGLPVVTDGEFRRLNWQVSFSEVEGWDLWAGSWRNFLRNPENRAEHERPLSKGDDAVVSFRAPATARLRLVRSFPLEEHRFLRSVATRPVKVTLMGPDRVAQMCDIAGSRAVYADSDAFLADVVRIQRQMVEELVAAGCDYVQLDEPSYTGYVDPPTLARMRASGEDPLRNLDRAIAADNAVIAGLQGRATFGLHVCRGNRASMWHREGTYDAIAERLFSGLAFDRLLLEYDTERAGGFEPLRFVPKGRIAVLGLITTKTGRVETVEELARRIDEASRFLPLDQLALSPQCGFASGIAGNLLTEDEQWRKLDVMLETARKVWQ
ncbi:MAG TPA: 5-methyltetrahydropteroyltriglutamate--homocysteine S-methyltransferase [Burkholderiales bacterium]|nr:5-methyltetrahydropteroyltriglutamate--homocysteine S-methyltransferase [Burkholderiales bacterium]